YGAALGSLLAKDLFGNLGILAAEDLDGSRQKRRVYDLKPLTPHFEPKAKAVIHLFMNGGPSQMDLFDPKPMLEKHHGEPYFEKIAGDVENIRDAGALMRSPFRFARHGKCGMWVSEAMPHIGEQVDDLALIRSMHT